MGSHNSHPVDPLDGAQGERGPWRARLADPGLALLLVVVVLAVLAAFPQARINVDAKGFLGWLDRGLVLQADKALYLPAASAMQWLVAPFGGGPTAALTLLSSLGVALGTAGTFLLARGLGRDRSVALVAALLVATSPGALFHGTRIEVHGLHLGLVALGAALAFTRRSRVWVALLAGVVGLVLAYMVHTLTALLIPAWILGMALLWPGSERPSLLRRLEVATLVLVVGWVAAGWSWAPMREQVLAGGQTPLDVVRAYGGHVSYGRSLVEGILLPLGALLPFGLLGLGRDRSTERLALGAAVLVPIGFLVWWRVPELGGYTLVTLPFLALLAADVLPRVRRGWWVAGLVALQLGVGVGFTRSYDSVLDPNDRVAAVQACIGESGVLVTALPFGRPIEVDLPEVDPVRIELWVWRAYKNGVEPEAFGAWAAEELRRGADARPGQPIAWEANLEMAVHMGTASECLPWLWALDGALGAHFERGEPVVVGDWRMVALTPRTP